MAKIEGFDEAAFAKWLKGRPKVIREMAKRCPLNLLYRLKSTGQRATLYSYSENRTVTVNITGEYNAMMFDRRVFGIDIDDLEECDFPASDEPVGTLLTEQADIDSYVDLIRPAILAAREDKP